MDATEAGVEAAPPCHTVDIGRDLRRGQRLQLVIGERHRLLDLAEDLEVPRRELRLRHGAGVENGPLLCQVLPRGKTGRIEPFVDQLLLRFGPEEGHAGLD